MSEQPNRTARTVGVADHLWDALAVMSQEMGVDRDGLVNQALFTYARLHGYVVPGTSSGLVASEIRSIAPLAAPAPVIAAPPIVAAIPAPAYATPYAAGIPVAAAAVPTPIAAAPVPAPISAPPVAAAIPAPGPIAAGSAPFGYGEPAGRYDDTPPSGVPAVSAPAYDPSPAYAAPAYEEPPRRAAPAPIPNPAVMVPVPAPAPAPDLGSRLNPDEVRAAQERVLQKAAELERLVRGGANSEPDGVDDSLLGRGGDDIPMEEGTPSPAPRTGGGGTLVLVADGREVDRVTGPRFLIGRGKHCDLIINSGKVSREHAAITREGDGYFIEDLGSSNGTWFDKKRITRRKVEEGDEYFICSEKILCRFE